MVDMIDQDGQYWQISFSGLEASEAICDGEIVEAIASIETDARPGRIWVNNQLAHAAKVGDDWWIHLNGKVHKLTISEQGAGGASNDGGMTAPMPGKILEVLCKVGDKVSEGDSLIVMEAMKMEHRILATSSGIITNLHFSVGEQVDAGASLAEIEEIENSN